MSNRDAAPLTARLLARKTAAGRPDTAQPTPTESAERESATAIPAVANIHEASPTLHTVDLTPPDFLRTEDGPKPTSKPKDRDRKV